jgi:hypothetical protein
MNYTRIIRDISCVRFCSQGFDLLFHVGGQRKKEIKWGSAKVNVDWTYRLRGRGEPSEIVGFGNVVSRIHILCCTASCSAARGPLNFLVIRVRTDLKVIQRFKFCAARCCAAEEQDSYFAGKEINWRKWRWFLHSDRRKLDVVIEQIWSDQIKSVWFSKKKTDHINLFIIFI